MKQTKEEWKKMLKTEKICCKCTRKTLESFYTKQIEKIKKELIKKDGNKKGKNKKTV